MTHPNVPFARDIVLGTSGDDVLSRKRALSRAAPALYPWQQFTPYCGPFFVTAFVEWKRKHGLGTTEKFGGRANEVLEKTRSHNRPTEWAFDALAIKLGTDYYNAVTVSPEDALRQRIVAAAAFVYHHRASMAYSMYRPFWLGKPPLVPPRGDCSSFFTLCYYIGGAPDPNGRGYDHEGYTGTLMTRGTRVSSVLDLKPGDAIFYGHSVAKPGFNAGDPTHVALYAGEDNGKHYVYSNGHYPMVYTLYSYRSDLNHFRHYDLGV